MGEWYLDFVDIGYAPSDEEILVDFYLEPRGVSPEEAAGRVASESSIGTWTTLWKLPERAKELMARVYELERQGDGYRARIAYPLGLWEAGNLVQLLSGIAGNIFGMKAVKNLRLEDFQIPESYAESFPGPEFGIEGVRKLMGVEKRPLTATVPKPKIGWSTGEYLEIARELWLGGIDLLKDDENFTSLDFNRFEERVSRIYRLRDEVEKETGERKEYLVNITAPYREMERRARLVAEHGGGYVMIDIVVTGFSALQSMREVCGELELAIHAHRAMHAAFTRNPRHGISMLALAKFARIAGVDQLHTGTAIGKLESKAEEVKRINRMLTCEWYFKPVLPVSSGGLHPGLIPEILQMFGTDLAIQAGGGVMGHPRGPRAGAQALRQAIDAAIGGESLEERAKRSPELREALEKWGYLKPV
ncbi:MAG: type III ribulose-bisphosphate carboxylase [Euryarchaeota archaeon]|nr:type III ribulose-bisphosphate carboxylase [Euryarchaeota archaeon]